MLMVSSCLAGIECRYDGKSNTIQEILELVKKGVAIPVCPEVLGGLETPRIPCEIIHSKVMTECGDDVTEAFMRGGLERHLR